MKLYLYLTALICLILAFFPLCCITVSNSAPLSANDSDQKLTQNENKEDDETVAVFIVSANKTIDIKVLIFLLVEEFYLLQ